jgi:predicted dehydrogenase
MIHAGELGEIRHLRAVYLQDWLSGPDEPWSWRMSKGSAGSGALGDIGTHIIDLARFLIGEVTTVAGSLRTFTRERPRRDGGTGVVDVDDAATAVVEFACGALGTLEASRVALGRRNHLVLEVNGSRGSLRFNLERLNELDVYDPRVGGFANVLVTQPDHPFMRNWWPAGHIIGWEHTFVHEIAHLLDAIVHDRPVGPYGATFEDGYRALVVAEALARSAAEGSRVAIPT